MFIEWIFLFIALFWLSIASICDLKTREVPNWISYSLISLGLGLRFLYSLSVLNFSFFLSGLFGFLVFFLLGILLYYSKQWGGADSKVLMGIGAVFGWSSSLFNTEEWPFPLVFFLHLLVIGSFYGLTWGLIIGLRERKKVMRSFQKIVWWEHLLVLSSFVIIFLFFSFLDRSFVIFGFLLALVLPFLFYLLRFFRAIEKSLLYKKIPVSEVVEGDWLAADVFCNGKVLCSSKSLGVSKKDILQLQKYKIKDVIIKEGIAFVPCFPLALVLSLYVGNLFYLFL